MTLPISKRKIVLLVFLFVLFLGCFFFIFYKNSKQAKPTPVPSPQAGAQYKNLTPGSSTKEEVLKNLGDPLKEKEENGIRILEYQSNSPNFNNEVSIKEENLTFVKEIVTLEDNIRISDINQKYGNYEYILYGPGSIIGFNLYVYLSKGIAYIGHQESGLIDEIWYFPPTDFESFRKNYAPGYGNVIKPVQ